MMTHYYTWRNNPKRATLHGRRCRQGDGEIVMPAYNFQARFADAVESGRKRQTIRPCRKRPTKPGDTLYLFSGQRSKQCRRLGTHTCKSVVPVDIPAMGFIRVHGMDLTAIQIVDFIQADGFDDMWAFFDFFRQHYGIPCIDKLELITW